jgi:hypothetical protein
MEDKRLSKIILSVEAAQEVALKKAQEMVGEDAWTDIEFPSFILLLPGQLVSGRPIASTAYLKRMSDLIERVPGDTMGKTITPLFFQDLEALADNFEESDSVQNIENSQPTIDTEQPSLKTPENIYLSNAVVISGRERFNLPLLTVQSKAVQGWTLGALE